MSRERMSRGEILGWSVVGFGAGIAGGLWLASRLGRMSRGRVADEAMAFGRRRGPSAMTLAGAVRAALARDPALAAHALDAIGVSRGTVELTGWVPDRAARAHAFRVANQVPGLDDVINSILVHGEDDLSGGYGSTAEARPA